MPLRLVFVLVLSGLLADTLILPLDRIMANDDLVIYDQVSAVFRKHCVSCHNAERPRGDFDISSMDAIRAGSASGPVSIPADPENSHLLALVTHKDEPFMPPNSPRIPQREIDLIRRWIEGGMLERKGDSANRNEQDPMPTETKDLELLSRTPVPAIVPVASLARPMPITALAASPTEPVVAISGNRQAVLFSLADFKPVKAFDFPEGEVHLLKFSADGELLLIGGGTGAMKGIVAGVEVKSGRRLFELGDESDVVLTADLSPDKQLVALGGPGRTVRVFRTADGELLTTLRKHTDWILSVAFSPDGLFIASGDRFGGLYLWEPDTGNEFLSLRGHVGAVYGLSWSDDSERLLSAGEDGTLRWWDLHSGASLADWKSEDGGILDVTALENGWVLSGGRAKRVELWRAQDDRIWELSVADEILNLAVTGDGNHAIAADAGGQIHVLALDSGSPVGKLELPIDASLIRQSQPKVYVPVARAAIKPSLPREFSIPSDLELLELREAVNAAEAAVTAAEESLNRARETAARTKDLLIKKEFAAKHATRNVGSSR